MTTMNISLPKELKAFVDNQVKSRRYSTSSEYIRELLREKEIAWAENDLRNKILSARKGSLIEITPDFFTKKYIK